MDTRHWNNCNLEQKIVRGVFNSEEGLYHQHCDQRQQELARRQPSEHLDYRRPKLGSCGIGCTVQSFVLQVWVPALPRSLPRLVRSIAYGSTAVKLPLFSSLTFGNFSEEGELHGLLRLLCIRLLDPHSIHPHSPRKHWPDNYTVSRFLPVARDSVFSPLY